MSCAFDAKTGNEVLCNERAHFGPITGLEISPDRAHFITSNKDKTARVRSTLYLLSAFFTERIPLLPCPMISYVILIPFEF